MAARKTKTSDVHAGPRHSTPPASTEKQGVAVQDYGTEEELNAFLDRLIARADRLLNERRTSALRLPKTG